VSETKIYWHSRDDGPWERITVSERSIVSWRLSILEPGEIWDDGYGNRYRYEVKR
jgi:hypothetical protein